MLHNLFLPCNERTSKEYIVYCNVKFPFLIFSRVTQEYLKPVAKSALTSTQPQRALLKEIQTRHGAQKQGKPAGDPKPEGQDSGAKGGDTGSGEQKGGKSGKAR